MINLKNYFRKKQQKNNKILYEKAFAPLFSYNYSTTIFL